MLGVGCYLTGFALGCSAARTSAAVVSTFGLAFDSRVATLLLSSLWFSIASGASDSATECCVIWHTKYHSGGLRVALYVSCPLPLERVAVFCQIMSGTWQAGGRVIIDVCRLCQGCRLFWKLSPYNYLNIYLYFLFISKSMTTLTRCSTARAVIDSHVVRHMTTTRQTRHLNIPCTNPRDQIQVHTDQFSNPAVPTQSCNQHAFRSLFALGQY